MYGLQQGFINFICIKSLETCRTREPMINSPQHTITRHYYFLGNSPILFFGKLREIFSTREGKIKLKLSTKGRHKHAYCISNEKLLT